MRIIQLTKGKKLFKNNARMKKIDNKGEIEMIKIIKERKDINIQSKFTEHFSPNIMYFKEEFMIFASEGLICGLNEDEYNNNDWMLNQIEKFDPECVVLGNTSYTDMEYLKFGNRKFLHPPLYEPITAEQTMATKSLNDFFEFDIPLSFGFFIDSIDDSTIFQADTKLKRKIVKPELSLAKTMKDSNNKKIFFGAPNPLFTTEDLALSYSLDELQRYFHEVINHIDEYSVKEKWAVVTEPHDMCYNFRMMVLYKYPHLFKKKMMYNAALMRKLMKLYNKVGLTCDNYHANKTRTYVEDPGLPEFDQIYHQDEYYKKISTVLEKDNDCEDLIEKLAIINYLQGTDFKQYLEGGVNPFHDMFASRYEYIPLEDLIVIYFEKLEKYRKEMEKSFFRQLKNLKITGTGGRHSLEDFKTTMERIDSKLQK